MNTPLAPTAAQFLDQHHVTSRSAAQRDRLLTYLNSCLPPTDWRHAPALAGRVWQAALEQGGVDLGLESGSDPDSGLPAWLARIARSVLREHLHPALGVVDEPDASAPRQLPLPKRVHFHPVDRVLFASYRVVDRLAAA